MALTATSLGPFKRIVNVHWPTANDFLKVTIGFAFYGNFVQFPCGEDEPLPGDGGGIVITNSFNQDLQLVPIKNYADTDGITAIILGWDWMDPAEYTWSGIPVGDVITLGSMAEATGNRWDYYTVPYVPESYERTRYSGGYVTPPNSLLPSFNRGLVTTWEIWNVNWLSGPFCYDGFQHRWYDASGDYFDPAHSHLAATQVMDFSAFTIMHTPTGKVYEAVAAEYPSMEYGAWRVSLYCKRKPGT